jgi:hypothetical protein
VEQEQPSLVLCSQPPDAADPVPPVEAAGRQGSAQMLEATEVDPGNHVEGDPEAL